MDLHEPGVSVQALLVSQVNDEPAPLARLEGQIAVGALVRRFPKLALAGEPIRRPQITLRGLQSLPVSVA